VETGRRIVELLKEICAQGSAILMITHNLNLLSEYPGKVYRFADHHIEEISQQFSDFFEQNA
jgi:cell division transport system ATP-binding protein